MMPVIKKIEIIAMLANGYIVTGDVGTFETVYGSITGATAPEDVEAKIYEYGVQPISDYIEACAGKEFVIKSYNSNTDQTDTVNVPAEDIQALDDSSFPLKPIIFEEFTRYANTANHELTTRIAAGGSLSKQNAIQIPKNDYVTGSGFVIPESDPIKITDVETDGNDIEVDIADISNPSFYGTIMPGKFFNLFSGITLTYSDGTTETIPEFPEQADPAQMVHALYFPIRLKYIGGDWTEIFITNGQTGKQISFSESINKFKNIVTQAGGTWGGGNTFEVAFGQDNIPAGITITLLDTQA